jgi:hypothetical protein
VNLSRRDEKREQGGSMFVRTTKVCPGARRVAVRNMIYPNYIPVTPSVSLPGASPRVQNQDPANSRETNGTPRNPYFYPRQHCRLAPLSTHDPGCSPTSHRPQPLPRPHPTAGMNAPGSSMEYQAAYTASDGRRAPMIAAGTRRSSGHPPCGSSEEHPGN